MLKPMTINKSSSWDWHDFDRRIYNLKQKRTPISLDQAFNIWKTLLEIPFYFNKINRYNPEKTFGEFIDFLKREKYYIV